MGWTYTIGELAKAVGVAAPAAKGFFHAVSTDTRTLEPGSVFFALKGERFDGNAFVSEAFAKGAVAAVTTVSHDAGPCLIVSDPLAALQKFARWHRSRYSLSLVAITGSCGKTSSKDMIAAVLAKRYRVVKTKGNLNNEIGCPISLLEIDDATEKAVVEMGAAHRGDIAHLCDLAQPTEAAVTMVSPAHLEGFGSIQNVAAAKGEIVEALPADGIFYVNMDDEWCVKMGEKFPGKKVRYGTAGDIVLESCVRESSGEFRLLVRPVGELCLPLPSRAHVWNALLAIAVGMQHGIGMRHGVCESPRYFEEPLREACAFSSRFRILKVGDIEIIDDAYNANPASMAAALEALVERPANKRAAAIGDMLELGAESPTYHQRIGERAGELGVNYVFARGEHAEKVVEGAKSRGVEHAAVIQNPEEMADAIRSILEPGDALLVKGSRGMRMEKVIDALKNALERNNT